MNKGEKIPAGDIKANSVFLRWLDNFWYHNKAIILITLFVIFVIVICTLQMCSVEKEDISLLYGGPCLLNSSELEGVRSVFNTVMPEDYNGDGRKFTELITYQVMSAEQLKELSDGTGVIDSAYFAREYESYSNMLLTGECSVCLIDPWLYDSLAAAGRLRKLNDVLGSVPPSAYGEYGVRLGDTALYQYFEALRALPADTVVCLLSPYVFGKSSDKNSYADAAAMFSAIVNFIPPETEA